ncbi:MAG: CoB--CoM heterodisulfide reductase iron-sulfur subunit A family protein [Thermoplasmata archaeon]
MGDREGAGGPRIGVFVCHCGSNIGGTVDCPAVAEYATTLENVVVARANIYTCSTVGQEEIKKQIREHGLDRIVVASCTPRLHEATFKRVGEEAGLNPYMVHMVNLREQCSWVHQGDKERATEKAKELVRMGVARARMLEPLTAQELGVERRVLVIGGGIAGIQASLDLAAQGLEVVLVERLPSIGGRMAQLDKTFPTGDCAICVLAPKMVEVLHTPGIRLMTYSEVREVAGHAGSFDVRIERKPRYVDESKCVGCGICAENCPGGAPSEFDMGIGRRKAIYVPFPQAAPLKYTIDPASCIHFKTGKCGLCRKNCPTGAIDFEMKPQEVRVRVGAIIVATGFDPYTPHVHGYWGYREFANVITALELERMINASGPTRGEVRRPSDGAAPKRVAFIQCVGSRNWKATSNKYCSRVCCMYTMKLAQLLKEHYQDISTSVYYIDIRAFGKGFEEFYHRVRSMAGVEYIRGRPARLTEDPRTKNITIRAEETLLNKITEREFDLVVLSIGMVPSEGTEALGRMLGIPRSPDGFFQEVHPKLRPVDTSRDGVFICGCAQGPKDIPDTVAQAKAAASSAAAMLARGKVILEPTTAEVDEALCEGCGLCASLCPYGAPSLVETGSGKKARIQKALCHGCGTCAAACPRLAITVRGFSDEQLESEMAAALPGEGEKVENGRGVGG